MQNVIIVSFTLPRNISSPEVLELTSPVIVRAGRIGLILSPHALGVLVKDEHENNASRTADLWPENHEPYDTYTKVLPVGFPAERFLANQFGALETALFAGEALRVGRKKGLEVTNSNGQVDPTLTEIFEGFHGAANLAMKLDGSMSRLHYAAYVLAPGIVRLEDLGSSNGTVVMPLDIDS